MNAALAHETANLQRQIDSLVREVEGKNEIITEMADELATVQRDLAIAVDAGAGYAHEAARLRACGEHQCA